MQQSDFLRHRVHIQKLIGNKVLAEIHQAVFWKDMMAVFLLPCLFVAFSIYLSQMLFGFLWLLVFVLQGFLIQAFGLAAHELFTHRRVLGSFSDVFDLLFSIPIFRKPSFYKKYHLSHHRYLNTPNDPELQEIREMKGDVNWRRWIFSSIFGQFITQMHDASYLEKINLKKDKRDRLESYAVYMFLACLLLSCFWFGSIIFWGYVLPLVTLTPLFSVFRIVLEHADVDPKNPLQCATFYKTNVVTRLLFFFDSGDCHLVHHLYPKIPYYHMARAAGLMRPYLIEQGVYEHRSFFKLLSLFYVKNLPLRSPWFKHCR